MAVMARDEWTDGRLDMMLVGFLGIIATILAQV
jgi:hypothetical protein